MHTTIICEERSPVMHAQGEREDDEEEESENDEDADGGAEKEEDEKVEDGEEAALVAVAVVLFCAMSVKLYTRSSCVISESMASM